VDARSALFLALLSGLIVSAWGALWLWSQSPYGRYLDHGRWSDVGFVASWCSALPAGEIVVPALLYAGGWVLMIAAMMLPTTLPLLTIFRRVVAGRPDASRLLALVIAGYGLAWLAFGLGAHAIDWALLDTAQAVPWFVAHGWSVGAAVVAAAGLFQFSALKYRCLDKCRTPFGFVAERWRGAAPGRDAFAIGFGHGVFCVGCCWALMLLMFVVGTGNLGWMLGLAAVMAAEKNLPWGHRLSAPLGAALLAWSAAIVLSNLGFAA
jgi:predicted metal-binding membrane protein